MSTLTTHEAKAFYDKFGARQDSQSFYESSALEQLVAHASFGTAHDVFEFGCGTGRFALDLLQHHLPATAVYRGTDISTTMVDLATARLAPFADRASVTLSSGEDALPLADQSMDRVVSTYVLDLLPSGAVRRLLAEAGRVLRPDGLLCVTGITHGTTWPSRIVMGVWQWLGRRLPPHGARAGAGRGRVDAAVPHRGGEVGSRVRSRGCVPGGAAGLSRPPGHCLLR